MILLLKNIRYSSFESKVTVQDPAESFDARIYMNNVLDIGYRFFLALHSDTVAYQSILGNSDYLCRLLYVVFSMMANNARLPT
jgi:hypothetical protein